MSNTERELIYGVDKLVVFSSEIRRKILVSLLEAQSKGTPVIMEDLQKSIFGKNIKQQINVLCKVGFVDTKIIDIPERSPHPAYFLTKKAMTALDDIGLNESTIKSILERKNKENEQNSTQKPN